MLTVRASLGTSSEAGRHALRLAVLAALAEVIAQASGLSHGYWIVLTIFIVLRPDYSSTLYRGLQRAAGTVVGAGLGVATVLLVKVSLTALLCVIAVSLVAAYAVFTVNYLLYAVFLTDFSGRAAGLAWPAARSDRSSPAYRHRSRYRPGHPGLSAVAHLGRHVRSREIRPAHHCPGQLRTRAAPLLHQAGRCRVGPARLAPARRPPHPDRRGGVGRPAGRRA